MSSFKQSRLTQKQNVRPKTWDRGFALDIIPGNRRKEGESGAREEGVHNGENMTEALRLSDKFCAVEPLWERESRDRAYSPTPTFLLFTPSLTPHPLP